MIIESVTNTQHKKVFLLDLYVVTSSDYERINSIFNIKIQILDNFLYCKTHSVQNANYYVSPQWLTGAQVPMVCLVGPALIAEPAGAGVFVVDCS